MAVSLDAASTAAIVAASTSAGEESREHAAGIKKKRRTGSGENHDSRLGKVKRKRSKIGCGRLATEIESEMQRTGRLDLDGGGSELLGERGRRLLEDGVGREGEVRLVSALSERVLRKSVRRGVVKRDLCVPREHCGGWHRSTAKQKKEKKTY